MEGHKVLHNGKRYIIPQNELALTQLKKMFRSKAASSPSLIVGHAHRFKGLHVAFYLAVHNDTIIEIAKRKEGFKPESINSDIVWPLLRGNVETTSTIEIYDDLPSAMKFEITNIVVPSTDLPKQKMRLFQGETPSGEKVNILTYKDKDTREQKEIFYIGQAKVNKLLLLEQFGVDCSEHDLQFETNRTPTRRQFLDLFRLRQSSPTPDP